MLPFKFFKQNTVLIKFLIILFFFIPFHFVNCGPDNTSAGIKPPDADSVVQIRIAVTGDIMCHSPQYNYARTGKGTFDFNPVFRYISKYLHDADFTMGNLETVTAGEKNGYSGYPLFNTPDEFITSLKQAGFNLLSTANNHALDQGEKGVLRTIDLLNKNNLFYNGTFISQHDRDSIRIFNIKGIKTAFLNYTYGTNGNPVPKNKDYIINLIDTLQIKKDIFLARQLSDIVIVHYHFGEEYERTPSPYQIEIVNKTKEYGADIIIGGHPHVLQPASLFKTKEGKIDTGYVIYSMGNFLSNQRKRYRDSGVILYLNIEKNFTKGTLKLKGIDYVPTWVYRGSIGKLREYLVLPSSSYNDSTLTFLSKYDRLIMQQAFEDSKNILNIR